MIRITQLAVAVIMLLYLEATQNTVRVKKEFFVCKLLQLEGLHRRVIGHLIRTKHKVNKISPINRSHAKKSCEKEK